jgi:mono/diheme cytochrome c family protein
MIKACIFLFFFSACINPAFAQKRTSPEQLKKGESLYISCIHCHGTTSGALAYPLQRIRKVRSADYLYKLMQDPMKFAGENKTAKKFFEKRGLQMPSYDHLSREELKAIFDYPDSLPYDPENYTHRKRSKKP